MIKRLLSVAATLLLLTAAADEGKTSPVNGLSGVIPEVQEAWSGAGGAFQWMPGMRLHAPADASELIRNGIALLQQDFSSLRQMELEVDFDLPSGQFLLLLGTSVPRGTEVPPGFDAYAITVDADGVELTAATEAGIFYGIQSLRQMYDAAMQIPAVHIRDWADQEWRVCYLGVADPAWIIPKLARLKINMVIVESYWYGAGNWWFTPVGANRAAAERFGALARQNNIEVVPLVQGGGWAYGVIDRNPNCGEGVWIQDEKLEFTPEGVAQLAFPNIIRSETMPVRLRAADGTVLTENVDYALTAFPLSRPFPEDAPRWQVKTLPGGLVPVSADYNYIPYSPHQTPYCPSEPETYAILQQVLKDVVEIYHPRFLHIGHDEVIRRNTCSRCQQRQLDKAELAGTDLRWWYDTLKSLNPELVLMMWDDILRRDGGGGALLEYLPEDVIICPWIYTADAEARKSIQDLMQWFRREHDRPAFGTASGYFPDNVLLWRDEIRPYRGEPGTLGMMFTHWGESMRLWGTLPMAAEFMWSAERPGSEDFAPILQAEYQFGDYGFRPALEYALQAESMAQAVNDGKTDVAVLRQKVAAAVQAITSRRLPGFRNAVNPFPEASAMQLERLADWYEAMVVYSSGADVDRAKLKELLMRAAPERREEWQKILTAEQLPDAVQLFGVTLQSREKAK